MILDLGWKKIPILKFMRVLIIWCALIYFKPWELVSPCAGDCLWAEGVFSFQAIDRAGAVEKLRAWIQFRVSVNEKKSPRAVGLDSGIKLYL